jgi:hypothetical protein
MRRTLKVMLALCAAIVAGGSLFMVLLIVTGAGPGVPRLPKRTSATILPVHRELVSLREPRYGYLVTLQWTNADGAVIRERDAWGTYRSDLAEGATRAGNHRRQPTLPDTVQARFHLERPPRFAQAPTRRKSRLL